MTEKVAKVYISKSSYELTSANKVRCVINLTCEVDTQEEADKICARFKQLEVPIDPTLHSEAIDILQDRFEEATRAIEALKAAHRLEIAQHLQTASLQTAEINRLKSQEDELRTAAEHLALYSSRLAIIGP